GAQRGAEGGVGAAVVAGESGAVGAALEVLVQRLPLGGVEVLGGPVEGQEQAGSLAVHHGPSRASAARDAGCSRRWRRCALARARRDMTVPSGTPICSAMSR